MTVKNKVALVTGSSRGIGNEIVKKLASAECDVVINYRKAGGASQKGAEELCAQVRASGRQALVVCADIAVREAVRYMMAETKKHYGKLDFLILNAARAPFKPLEKLRDSELRQLVDTNYLGNIFCVQEALPLLEETHGGVVFMSSLGSRFHNPAYPLGTMKAAMECAVKDLSESLRDKNVSVNGICAGLVKTDSFKLLRQLWQGLDRVPEECFVGAEEVADVVLFLCSAQSRAIRGQTIVVDRGMSNRISFVLGT